MATWVCYLAPGLEQQRVLVRVSTREVLRESLSILTAATRQLDGVKVGGRQKEGERSESGRGRERHRHRILTTRHTLLALCRGVGG